jgi:sporulation protein YpjB
MLLLIGIGLVALLQGCSQEAARSPEAGLEPDPATAKKLEELNQTADELYKRTAAGQYEEARTALERLGEQVTGASYVGVTGVEGVNALSEAVVEAKRLFNAARLDPEKTVKVAAGLKLAADALTHTRQPMWLQYYPMLSQDTKRLEEAVQTGNKQETQKQFAAMKAHYDIVRPSVWISRTPEQGETMDSLLVFFTKYTDPAGFQKDVLLPGIQQWKEALRVLFGKEGDRTAYMPVIQPDRPVLWTLTIGSLIAAVLTFAGWRMFRTDRESVRKPRYRSMDGE